MLVISFLIIRCFRSDTVVYVKKRGVIEGIYNEKNGEECDVFLFLYWDSKIFLLFNLIINLVLEGIDNKKNGEEHDVFPFLYWGEFNYKFCVRMYMTMAATQIFSLFTFN